MAAGKKIAPGRTRAGPVVIPWAAGDTGTTGPGGDDIRAVRRAAADPVRGSKAGRPGLAVLASQQHGQDLTDGGLPAGGLAQRQVRLDLVAVAAAEIGRAHV